MQTEESMISISDVTSSSVGVKMVLGPDWR